MRNGSNKFLMTKQPQEHWSWISACCKASCSHCSGCTHDKAHAFLDPRVTTRFPMVGQRSKQGDYVTWKNPSEKLNAAQTCLPLPSQWFAKISLINLQMGKLHLHVCLTMSIPTNNFYKQKRGMGGSFRGPARPAWKTIRIEGVCCGTFMRWESLPSACPKSMIMCLCHDISIRYCLAFSCCYVLMYDFM